MKRSVFISSFNGFIVFLILSGEMSRCDVQQTGLFCLIFSFFSDKGSYQNNFSAFAVFTSL